MAALGAGGALPAGASPDAAALAVADSILADADADGDGEISRDEFIRHAVSGGRSTSWPEAEM